MESVLESGNHDQRSHDSSDWGGRFSLLEFELLWNRVLPGRHAGRHGVHRKLFRSFQGRPAGLCIRAGAGHYRTPSLWGLNGFSKTLIGFSSYYLIRYLVVESSVGRAALLFFLSLLDVVIIYAFLLLLTPTLTDGVVTQALLKALLTALSGAALFWMLDRLRFSVKDYRHL